MGRGENRDAGPEALLALMAHRCAALGPGAAIPCAMTAGAARIAVRAPTLPLYGGFRSGARTTVGDRAPGGGAGKRAGAGRRPRAAGAGGGGRRGAGRRAQARGAGRRDRGPQATPLWQEGLRPDSRPNPTRLPTPDTLWRAGNRTVARGPQFRGAGPRHNAREPRSSNIPTPRKASQTALRGPRSMVSARGPRR
jgi:hypothetical protein